MKLYKSYLFRDKDPAIDELRTLVQNGAGSKITRKTLKKIEIHGGPQVSTVASWFFGKTKRPQNATLEAAGRALGFQRKWTKMKG